ncbi:MAG: hypothetical protein K0U93_24415 [Gammaproteobacteria bacterium]|nr:hypothetical protein [Gammaproteobacteria bacterium]
MKVREGILNLFPVWVIALGLTALTVQPAFGADTHIATFWQEGDTGQMLHLRGRVVTAEGKPVTGATIMLRQADGSGTYQPQRYQGEISTGPGGVFEVRTVLPGQYNSAKHIHVTVLHTGFQTLDTELLFIGDPNAAHDQSYGTPVVLEEVRSAERTLLVGGVELTLSK